MAPDIAGFTPTTFSHDGRERTVYRAGDGPAVLVLAEMPGITPLVTAFAERLVAAGFTAVMPQLFGTPGQPATAGGFLRSIASVCVSKEFVLLAKGRNAPVTDWLRALARNDHRACGGPGVGVVGMCFTGGFALAMAAEAAVLAPVMSQPSLPFGPTAAHRADLGVDGPTLDRVKERCATEDLRLLGLRFTGDRLCPPERFARLRAELGEHFIGVEIDSGRGNPHGIAGSSHSVLTEQLVDTEGHPTHAALGQVLELLRSRLLTPDASR